MREWLNTLLPEGTPAGQARAVTCDEELVTVGAGAGTGKTWVLSARFAYLLLSGGDCLPQNLLTLTFTEAASREMQERIRKRTLDLLDRAGRDGQEDGGGGNDRQAVRDGFDEMWISTIHSFASRVIRESGLSLDIDPQSKIVEPPQEEEFWSALTRALETLELAAFASAHGKRNLREEALALEQDEALQAALEKWGAADLCEVTREVIELHSSLGHDGETLFTWASEADPRRGGGTDTRARAAAEAVAELLRPIWSEAWEVWGKVFSEFSGEIAEENEKALGKPEPKRASHAAALAGIMERRKTLREAPPPLSPEEMPEEMQRLFFCDLCANLVGGNSKMLKNIAASLGQTVSAWRDERKKWLPLSETSPRALLSEPESVCARLCCASAPSRGAYGTR